MSEPYGFFDLIPTRSRFAVPAHLTLALAGGVTCSAVAFAFFAHVVDDPFYPYAETGSVRAVFSAIAATLVFVLLLLGGRLLRRPHRDASLHGVVVIAGLSPLFGAAATIASALGLGRRQLLFDETFDGMLMGAVYGAPLAVLAVLTSPFVIRTSLGGDERALRIAGVWSALGALVGFFEALHGDGGSALTVTVDRLLCAAVFVAGLTLATAIHVRIGRRRRFLERVDEGKVPGFTLRAAAPEDDLDGLPRLDDVGRVVPTVLALSRAALPHSPYRQAAVGRPLAVVR